MEPTSYDIAQLIAALLRLLVAADTLSWEANSSSCEDAIEQMNKALIPFHAR